MKKVGWLVGLAWVLMACAEDSGSGAAAVGDGGNDSAIGDTSVGFPFFDSAGVDLVGGGDELETPPDSSPQQDWGEADAPNNDTGSTAKDGEGGVDLEDGDVADDPKDTGMDGDVIENPCEGAADGTPCDVDADACTVDVCATGVCVPTGQDLSCADVQAAQPCWTFVCSKKSGCVPAVFVDGNSCNDGNPCTITDTCQELDFKACAGTPVPVDDNNPCTDDYCKDGTVLHPAIDGIPCEKGGEMGTCKDGVCQVQGCVPVDGGFGAWSFGPCSKACGGGVQTGTRICNAPPPSCGGADCQGPAVMEQTCNVEPCPVEPGAITCAGGPQFAPLSTCTKTDSVAPFTVVKDTGASGDSYGVSAVRGPNNTIAILHRQQEYLLRMDEAGNILFPSTRLPTLNPSLEPQALGDSGWPAFYGPELATDGTLFGVSRPFQSSDKALFYTVDANGVLKGGPLAIDPPGSGTANGHGSALEWGGSAWYLVWEVTDINKKLLMAKILPSAQLDTSWADGGFLTVHINDGYAHPELAIDSGGTVAAVVWGESSWGTALVDLKAGTVLAKSTGGCPTGIGTNGDGHDVTWNAHMGEFGVMLSGQGAGLCDGLKPFVNGALLRLSPSGNWIGSPVEMLCGFTIGAGHRGGIAAYPDGRYALSTVRYHTKPFCVDGFPNGTQGIGAVEMAIYDPKFELMAGAYSMENAPKIYSQVDIVYTGSRMATVSGVLTAKNTLGVLVE